MYCDAEGAAVAATVLRARALSTLATTARSLIAPPHPSDDSRGRGRGWPRAKLHLSQLLVARTAISIRPSLLVSLCWHAATRGCPAGKMPTWLRRPDCSRAEPDAAVSVPVFQIANAARCVFTNAPRDLSCKAKSRWVQSKVVRPARFGDTTKVNRQNNDLTAICERIKTSGEGRKQPTPR